MNAETKLNEARRIAILLADKAVQPLPEAEYEELDHLLARHQDVDDSELDEAASALHLAKPLLPESMPETLRARVFADAERFFGASAVEPTPASVEENLTLEFVSEIETDSSVGAAAARPEAATDVVEPHIQSISSQLAPAAVSAPALPPLSESAALSEQTKNENPVPVANVVAFPSSPKPSGRIASVPVAAQPAAIPSTGGWVSRLGWLAAAACLSFALVGVWKVRQQQKQLNTLMAEKSVPNLAAQRQALIAQGGEMIQLNWAAGGFPGMQRVKGDIVWSDTAQKGYMRFVGMPANNPNEAVYQLWIFAANQEEKFPIDGGIFDITTNGEIIVPINAKLEVSKPSLFAITIEKPGGVVVSKRDKLALLAKVG